MQASIESVCRGYPDRPVWLVLGDMRELGSISRQEHADLGRWIAAQSVRHLFLYGRDTRFILEGLSSGGYRGAVERHSKKRRLVQALELGLKTGTKPVILFKASRSLRLEQVTHALLSQPS
jgi:UDP-N-acetylmuramoyl-tripeptide--D-alanyl-D-alanine ligase